MAKPTPTREERFGCLGWKSLEAIEAGLRGCRDLTASIGEDVLAYMIDMAIAEAQEHADRDRPQSRVHLARRVSSRRVIKVGLRSDSASATRYWESFRHLLDQTDYRIANGRVFDSEERPHQASALLWSRRRKIGCFEFHHFRQGVDLTTHFCHSKSPDGEISPGPPRSGARYCLITVADPQSLCSD